jgi:hypothetical protein
MSEHDENVRLKERTKIFLEWMASHRNFSETDTLSEWEDFENQVMDRVEKKFRFIFEVSP